ALGAPLAEPTASLVDFTDAIGVSVRYSLLQRDSNAKTNSIHRLVQTVIRNEMSKAEQRLWAERAVRSVNSSFPEDEYYTWPDCERLIQHVHTLSTVIENFNFAFPEGAQLLSRAGSFLKERGGYGPAEKLLKHSLQIYEMTSGAAHHDAFQVRIDLADVYRTICAYPEAEQLYQQCKTTREEAFGLDHPDVARVLNRLAVIYTLQARYDDADLILGTCLAIYQNANLEESSEYAKALSDRGGLYQTLAKYEEAESLYKTA